MHYQNEHQLHIHLHALKLTVQIMNKMYGVVIEVNLKNRLFSVKLEDGNYSVCFMRAPINLEVGSVLFGSFKCYGMNYLETERNGEEILVDTLHILISEETAKYFVSEPDSVG